MEPAIKPTQFLPPHPLATQMATFPGCCSARIITYLPNNAHNIYAPIDTPKAGVKQMEVDPEAFKLRIMSHEAEARNTQKYGNASSNCINALQLTVSDHQESFHHLSKILLELKWTCVFKFASHSYGGSLIYVWMKPIRPVPEDKNNVPFNKGAEIYVAPTEAVQSREAPAKVKKTALNRNK